MIWISSFVIGMMSSMHCIGMCGPISFVVANSSHSPWLSNMTYNVGRICSYVFIGLVVGFFSSIAAFLMSYQQYISILIGVLFLLFGIGIVNPEKTAYKIWGFKHIGEFIKDALSDRIKSKKLSDRFILGIANGFLPCGMVYMATLGALNSSNVLDAALYMLFFGLGTLPMMGLIFIFGNSIFSSAQSVLKKATPIAFIIIGSLMIYRGIKSYKLPWESTPDELCLSDILIDIVPFIS